MAVQTSSIAGRPRPQRKPVLPNSVLGTVIFIFTEIMLFAGLVSAHMIVKSTSTVGWPPPGQPRLPVEATALNTLALLASGVVMFFANRAFKKDPAKAKLPLLASVLLGAFFVVFQGTEWVRLIGEGLSVSYSNHSSFFYLIIGVHGVHAVVAILIMAMMFVRLLRKQLQGPAFWAAQVFWYFVVGVWPILYYQVYL